MQETFSKSTYKLNINFDEGFILWTPPHTASRTLTGLFNHLNFKTYLLSDNSLTYYHSGTSHNHNIIKFDELNELKTIISIRNPYLINLALFKLHHFNIKRVPSTFNFKEKFREHCFMNELSFSEIFHKINDVKIDYRINQESILKDLFSIPIRGLENEDKKNKIIELSSQKIGDFRKTEIFENFSRFYQGTVSSLYDEESAETFYNEHSKVFDVMSFKKDSWKYLENSVF